MALGDGWPLETVVEISAQHAANVRYNYFRFRSRCILYYSKVDVTEMRT